MPRFFTHANLGDRTMHPGSLMLRNVAVRTLLRRLVCCQAHHEKRVELKRRRLHDVAGRQAAVPNCECLWAFSAHQSFGTSRGRPRSSSPGQHSQAELCVCVCLSLCVYACGRVRVRVYVCMCGRGIGNGAESHETERIVVADPLLF